MNTTCGFESHPSLATLQREPRVRLEALLGPVSVVVEQLFALLDLRLGYQNQLRVILHHDDLGLEIRVHAGVVDESADAAGFSCGVDTENFARMDDQNTLLVG